jgi:3-dehydroquinate synthetase
MKTLELAELPTGIPPGSGIDAVIQAMRSDKKVRLGSIELSLPLRIGAMAGEMTGWTTTVTDDQLREVLAQ